MDSVRQVVTGFLFFLMALTPCGLRGQTNAIYIASDGITGYRVGADGSLTAFAGSPVALGSGAFPFALSIDPLGRYLYVVGDASTTSIFGFAIGATGALTPIPGSPFPTGLGPSGVVVDPTGRYAFVSSTSTATLYAYTIGAGGALTAVPGSPFITGSEPFTLAVESTGHFVYVPCSSSGGVFGYAIGAGGVLTPIPGSPFATGIGPTSVTTTGSFLYATNENSDSVSAYTIGANGALTPISGSPFPAGSGPVALSVDPTGHFLYVANLTAPGLSAYTIGPGGALSQVPGSPFSTTIDPAGLAVDSSGHFLYNSSEGSNLLGAFSIGPDGALSPLPGQPFANGSASNSVQASIIGLPTLVSIAVTPPNPSITVGTTQQFTATGTYSDNSTRNLTTSVTWVSDTASVATISNAGGTQGLATGAGQGTSNITASLNGVTSPADLLTVNLAAQTINFPNPGNQLYGVPFNLIATATSGLVVTFNSLTASTCTVSGTQANFIALGPCTIQANQAGGGNYSAANPVSQTLTPVVNVSGQVKVTQDGFARNRATGLWTATLTVTNTSATPISGPLSVGITNLSANAAMANNTGLFLGSPYIAVSAGTLGPAASVIVAIQFQDPSAGFINYIPVTYSGAIQTVR